MEAFVKVPRHNSRRVRWTALTSVVLLPVFGLAVAGSQAAAAATDTTAWQNGGFQLDPDGVVSQSDIVLGQPNQSGDQSMPLGNGSLAVAAWRPTASPPSSTAPTPCRTASRPDRSPFRG